MPAFLNTLFLAGLAGAALPLVIHLLNRDKPRQVDFGWFRFLAAAHRAQARRFKLRQILILLLRMLIGRGSTLSPGASCAVGRAGAASSSSLQWN